MNAGAYGGELRDVLQEATVLTKEGEIRTVSAEELKLGYRYSVIPEREWIVLAAKLRLKSGDPEMIRKRMEELKVQRVTKQPLDLPSAGSTFKRPEEYGCRTSRVMCRRRSDFTETLWIRSKHRKRDSKGCSEPDPGGTDEGKRTVWCSA